jgi:hypothetical protein
VVVGAASAAGAAGLAGLLFVLRRRRRQQGDAAPAPAAGPAPEVAGGPAEPAVTVDPAHPAAPVTRLQALRPSWLTASQARRGPGGADFHARPRARPPRDGGHGERPEHAPAAPPQPAASPALPQVAPPRLDEAWTAEITWDAGLSSFAVVAASAAAPERPVVLARTEALRWPPPDAAAVQALADATGSVRMVLEGSGWTALAVRGALVRAALRVGAAGRADAPGRLGPCTTGASAGPA